MGVILCKLGRSTPLLPGETVLLEQRRFWAISSKTLPSYRVGFNLRPFWGVRLLVTDRRCLVLTDFLYCMSQEIGLWYPGRNPEGDPETITRVSCRQGCFGKCLEICSNNPKRTQRWLWSPELTLRFFLKEPEPIEVALLAAMNVPGQPPEPMP